MNQGKQADMLGRIGGGEGKKSKKGHFKEVDNRHNGVYIDGTKVGGGEKSKERSQLDLEIRGGYEKGKALEGKGGSSTGKEKKGLKRLIKGKHQKKISRGVLCARHHIDGSSSLGALHKNQRGTENAARNFYSSTSGVGGGGDRDWLYDALKKNG